MKIPTVVDEVTDTLAYRIAAGVYPPGELMPSVRRLAAEFGISTPTINSALGRLATVGFVEARRGLGNVVRDIYLYGGVDTARYIFRFARQLPERSAKIFGDIIDVDHLLLLQAVRTVSKNPRGYDHAPLARAIERFELLVATGDAGVPDIMRAELHVLRVGLAAVGQTVYLSLFNSIGELLIDTPEAGRAFYQPLEPAGHVVVARKMLELWQSGEPADDADLDAVDNLIRVYHDQVTESFREIVTAEAAALERVPPRSVTATR
ncbi:FadR/GntR family transcriptional regulator [Nocardia jejuensis]|uniref:FadR/GntR family transcriptional regulator n=1 Tax=Nocardia jejuensis TaxID=328049 RepID=UPI0008326426|nr:GntR family transcriptional regulator [Nocardia jejuensis]